MKNISFFLFLLCATTTSAQTYYKDVAPIFYSHCTGCHNQYGHISLIGYSQVAKNKATIKAYLLTNQMPPWPADTTYTRFMHERFISAPEKAAIVKWITDGAAAGDTTLAPAPPQYSRFQLTGTPDLILKTQNFTSNASANDAYNCFSIPSGLKTDRYIYAYEIVPGNPSIVHHIIAGIDTTGTDLSDLSGSCYFDSTDYTIGAYIPGMEPTVFPTQLPIRMGIRIKAGSNIILQIHYPAGTAGQVDSTQIRLYFYPVGTTGIREVHVHALLKNWRMVIPANSVISYSAQYPLQSGGLQHSISLFSVLPHSHYLDTGIVTYAYSGSNYIPLLRIKNWNFDYQQYYTYHHLVKIPAGYTLYTTHTYNNTSRNPNNPFNPPKTIYSGFNTTDNEMLYDTFEWLTYQDGDENYNLDSLMQSNGVVNGIVSPLTPIGGRISVFPNPGNSLFTLESAGAKLGLVTVYSISGQLIYSKQLPCMKGTIDLSAEPAGIYFVHAGNNYLRIIKEN